MSNAHTCHWPGCNKEVPPAMWGCKPHWFSLPKHLRDRIWGTYRRGQEISKTPSREYLIAAQDVQRWILEQVRRERSIAAKARAMKDEYSLRTILYDVKCGDLAAHFLSDDWISPERREKHTPGLAQAIQWAIEYYFVEHELDMPEHTEEK